MTCASHCRGVESLFDRRTARRDLRRYRRRGPLPGTRRLLEHLRSEGVAGRSLLDIGGGVGAIQHELLSEGLSGATHVDASPAYLEASREEAERRGHLDRVRYLSGDVTEMGERLQDADIVTLDRVLCCYPDVEAIIRASAPRARRLYAVVYPRTPWWVRAWVPLANLVFRIRAPGFRLFLHPPERIDRLVRSFGLERRHRARTLIWNVVTYQRQTIP